MKRFLSFCCVFVLMLGAGLLLVGCSGGGKNNNPPLTPPPEDKTYSVKIKLNNSEYGYIVNDNLKTEYEYGEEINIRVIPNAGYFLEGYSDEPNNNSLNRTFIVTKNMDITVNLREGTEFSFYGYKVRLYGSEKPWNAENSMATRSTVITQNQTVNAGFLRLTIEDPENFGCYVFKQGEKDSLFSKNATAQSFGNDYMIYSKEQFDTMFEGNKKDYVDIHEYNTFAGYAFTQIHSDNDDPYNNIPLGKFDETEIHCQLNYLYVLDGTTYVKGFVKEGENTYSDTHLTGSYNSIAFNKYKLFTYNGNLYYFKSNNGFIFINNTKDYSPSWTVNGEEFNVTFKAPK